MSSARVNKAMEEVASYMLQYVGRHPFRLGPSAKPKGQRSDDQWCEEYQHLIQIGEEEFWKERVEYYRSKDLDEIT
jgi:hypothetical protein